MSATIRPAAAGDMASIWSLERAVFGSIVYPSFFIRQAFDLWGGLLWVAELPSGQLAGYGLAAPSERPGEAWILSVAVRPDLRGRGLGQDLIRALMRALAEHGHRTVRLTVHPHNEGAIRFYETLGFQREGVESDYFGPDEPRLAMRLSL